VRKANKGPLPDADIHHVYERVIEVMRNIQKCEIVAAAAEQTQKKSV